MYPKFLPEYAQKPPKTTPPTQRRMFILTEDELTKLKNINVNEFRYSLQFLNFDLQDFSVKNKVEVPALISWI
jgi:hypothetical protein